MLTPFPEGYEYVAVFAVASVAFAVLCLVIAWFLRPSDPYAEKLLTYECGYTPKGFAWVPLNFHYYILALIFVVFDVEIVFLFPWAMVLRELGMLALLEMAVFLGILLAGFAYAWRMGALRWV
ncbi:MAG: NADH-quinone oxidoreductase subunit A [Armatimonadota bacterium]|jgi:NADH-quinone oxidoreductase subunit A